MVCGGLASCAPAVDIESLLEDLRHPDYEARLEASEKLAGLMRDGNHKAFLRGMESDNLLVRAYCIVHLAAMPQPDARKATRDLLRLDRRQMLPFNPIQMKPGGEERDSRFLVAALISRMDDGDPKAIDVLLDGATVQQEPEVVTGTCLALGALRDPKGVPFLKEASGLEDEEIVRAAVEALGHIRTPESLVALGGIIGHPSLQVRSIVLSSLSMWSGQESHDLMQTIGASDPSHSLRSNAIQILAHSRDPRLIPYFIERLAGDESEKVRSAAVKALERISGQTFGSRADRWQTWWSENQDALTASR